MAPRAWPAPKTFGMLVDGQGVMFTCKGCGRHRAIDRHEGQRRWGTEGRPYDIAARFRCENCKGRGAYVERIRMDQDYGPTMGSRGNGVWDKFVRQIASMKPDGMID